MKKGLILSLVLLLVVSIFIGCTKDTAQPVSEVNESKDVTTDVLVIGGGGAGLVSAITAAESGANVILVEKMPAVGGNTIISATGMTASDTRLHEEAGIPFTVQDHIDRTMKEGKDLPNLELVTVLAENSNAGLEWLESLGLEYKLNEKEPWWIVPVEGHYGSLMVDAYRKEAAKHSNLEIRVNTAAEELVVEDGKVVGAVVKGKEGQYTIKANAVILATGGLGNAPEVIAEYNSKYAGGTGTMSTAGPTGDGLKMATAIGAAVVDMEHHMMRPLATPGYWIRETVVGEEGIGGILVNKAAERFTSETQHRWDLVPEVAAQEGGVTYVIFDADVAATNNGAAAIRNARMVEADTIEELATKLGLDPAALETTVDAYNNGEDEFGRTSMGKVTTAPFYGVQAEVSSHFTMGGLAFNKDAQILDTNGNAIQGLYGVGEVLGGLYGAGRVAGNDTMGNVVFGKIAGTNAANQ
ncbi:FAD-dependent oxidoreductase [Alkaliphilus transvaalensis]|uniref:FAD-dependent oxidoreductase n=1 Tax=Alkaliphilus transvaalensis TaxID=114628 RepID=UPI00047C1580|nr:FAD-dependent oxidoreductase [Alkaliphilus transvaalensis]